MDVSQDGRHAEDSDLHVSASCVRGKKKKREKMSPRRIALAALAAAALVGAVDAAPKKGPRSNADRELRTRRNECERDMCLGERSSSLLSPSPPVPDYIVWRGRWARLIISASRSSERGQDDVRISLHFASVLRRGVCK